MEDEFTWTVWLDDSERAGLLWKARVNETDVEENGLSGCILALNNDLFHELITLMAYECRTF
eukprot:2754-Eustigmatos_ZCMA.PRE.1